MTDKKLTYYFLLGAGGIGMSALALYLKKQGENVLGYDARQSQITGKLQAEGIKIFFRDDTDILPGDMTADNTVVIRTPAIKNSVLLDFFAQNNFKIYKRAEFLSVITNAHPQIAIAGTHGKTSTTAITAHILKTAGLLKVAFVGGITKNYNSNLITGQGQYAVVEADEYDKAFLLLHPEIEVITSIEPDHLDLYGNFDNILEAFRQFTQNSKDSGKIIVNSKIAKLLPGTKTYGIDKNSDFNAYGVKHGERKQIFTLNLNGEQIQTYINFPGNAYLENAIAAAAAAYLAGAPASAIKTGLETYKGTQRRFDLVCNKNGLYIYDDYAHHPTEIEKLYESARLFHPEQELTIIFQPHLYSRTRDFAQEFAKALEKFDKIIITDIYPAREEPMEGVDPQMILNKINNSNKLYVPKNDLVNHLQTISNGVLIFAGAGDINTISQVLTGKICN